MEQTTSCMVCQKNIAENKCTMCGAMICDEHFTKERHICSNCNKGQQ